MIKKIFFFFTSILIAEAKITKDKVVKGKSKITEKSGKTSLPAPKSFESEVKTEILPEEKKWVYRTYLSLGLGGGVNAQSGTFESREEQTIAYDRTKNTYSAQGFSGLGRFGIHTEQGILYLGTVLYGHISPLKKRVYYRAQDANNVDQIHVKSLWGAGAALHFGFKVNQVKPYVIFGVEYNPKELRYQAKAPGAGNINDVKWRKKNMTYPMGIGLSGELSKNVDLSFEVIRKTSQDFDVLVPDNASSLDDQRLRVTTPQWSAMMVVSYKFDLG